MSIVGTRRSEMFSPTVPVVLGSDWPMDETARSLLEVSDLVQEFFFFYILAGREKRKRSGLVLKRDCLE